MKGLDLIKTSAEIALNKLKSQMFSNQVATDEKVQSILSEIKTKGLSVIPGFFSDEIVDQFRLEVDRIMNEFKSQLWKDSSEADYRAFGVNQLSEFIDTHFYNEPLIVAVREAYYGLEDVYVIGCTMANKIKAIEGNLGSGGGWHRDTVNIRQLKAITYLTDVSENHGPFEYLIGTQNKQSVLEGIVKYDFEHNHNRFTDEEIETYLKENKYPLQVNTASKGSLILVDTSGIHRGKPIKSGERYALTNYYYVSEKKGGKGMPKNVSELIIHNN